MADAEATNKKSDLPVRFASAVVMLAVAGTALWLGGIYWYLLVGVIAVGVYWEFSRLILETSKSMVFRALWLPFGLIYIGTGSVFLAWAREEYGVFRTHPIIFTFGLLGIVVIVDVGAYFAGRTFGGPKIAPNVSPSKTWAGLLGGALAASIFFFLYEIVVHGWWAEAISHECLFREHEKDCIPSFERWERITDFYSTIPAAIFIGFLAAVVAQSGDFFESWLKRKAGVKDSSNLIPGHGGLFDRVDGLLAVCFFLAVFTLWVRL